MKGAKSVENVILREENISIIVEDRVISKIKKELTKFFNIRETGGTLIGYKLKDLDEYIVSDITTEQEKDEKGIYNFQRVDSNHMEIINKKWEKDKSTVFLGDWHIHPFGEKISASNSDYLSFKNISKNQKNTSINVFLIANQVEFRVFIYRKGTVLFEKKLKF